MRRMGRPCLRGAVILGVFLVLGCSSFRPPSVGVGDIAVTGATDEALAVAIVMELENPNAVPVELYEFRYTLAVNGKEVYAGRRAGGATLTASSTRQIMIPAVVRFEDMGWAADRLPPAAHYAVQGRLQFNAPNRLAQILFDTGVHRPKVAFSGEGELPLP